MIPGVPFTQVAVRWRWAAQVGGSLSRLQDDGWRNCGPIRERQGSGMGSQTGGGWYQSTKADLMVTGEGRGALTRLGWTGQEGPASRDTAKPAGWYPLCSAPSARPLAEAAPHPSCECQCR